MLSRVALPERVDLVGRSKQALSTATRDSTYVSREVAQNSQADVDKKLWTNWVNAGREVEGIAQTSQEHPEIRKTETGGRKMAIYKSSKLSRQQ